MVQKEEIKNWLETLQDNICNAIEAADGKGKFIEDKWDRDGGGGGRSRVLSEGNVIEKGGVNFSAVWGKLPEKMQQQMKVDVNTDFFATGVSIVMHPSHPMVPIIHMNVRYFEMSSGRFWFGGGIDLTPHYVDRDQASWFHQQLKQVCDTHGQDYDHLKKWADDYFYILHRQETRGVGGIFFDYLDQDKDGTWAFVQDVGNAFAPVYTHLMQLNREKPFTEEHKNWQYIRRGRYVEFNLVLDRGTKFGLETNGRTESILMSLPPTAQWFYNHQPEEGTTEAATLALLKKDVDWINI